MKEKRRCPWVPNTNPLYIAYHDTEWGVPVYDGGKFYIGAVRVGVNLGFSMLGLSENEMKRFEGKGRLMRHIKITNERDISEKGVIELLHVVKRS